MSSRLSDSLTQLRDALAAARLPLALPGTADQKKAIREITSQLDDYVLPRLATIDAPLLAVVGGSTGAGKSTLVNSLIGRRVTTPGVIRPTTRSPVLIFHPDDAGWFDDDRILPGLIRSTVSSNDTRSLQLVHEATLPRGLAVAANTAAINEVKTKESAKQHRAEVELSEAQATAAKISAAL